MKGRRIVIFGGSGFIGSVLAHRLASHGSRVDVPTRRRESAKHLWTVPGVRVVETDLQQTHAIKSIVRGTDAVINLIGILNERGDNGRGFERVHVTLTNHILNACHETNVARYVHMSALNADPFAASYYLRSKGEAEAAVLAAQNDGVDVSVFRPSVVFGPRDSLFNRFAGLLRLAVFGLPLACASSRMQPVYVGDLVEAVIASLDDHAAFGQRYDIGGPQILTLQQIAEYTNRMCGTKRLIIPLGKTLSTIQANIFEYIPGKPFSRDNLRSASEDSILTGPNGLDDFNITPTSVDAIVPSYLGTGGSRYDGIREIHVRARR